MACRDEVCGAAFGTYTRAELQLDSKGVDRYGISLAGGANIPIGVMPLGGDYTQRDGRTQRRATSTDSFGLLLLCVITRTMENTDLYYCTSTGMDCYWEFDAHGDIRYNAVFGGSGAPCFSQDDCNGSKVCGYNYTGGGIDLYCGVRYGYYSGTGSVIWIRQTSSLNAPSRLVIARDSQWPTCMLAPTHLTWMGTIPPLNTEMAKSVVAPTGMIATWPCSTLKRTSARLRTTHGRVMLRRFSISSSWLAPPRSPTRKITQRVCSHAGVLTLTSSSSAQTAR